MQGRLVTLLTLVLIAGLIPAKASEGDRQKVFKKCLKLCLETGCAQSTENTFRCRHALVCDESTSPYQSTALKLTHWDCRDECRCVYGLFQDCVMHLL